MVGTIVISIFAIFFHYLFFIHPIISNYKKIHREGEIVAKFKNPGFFVWLILIVLTILISLIIGKIRLYIIIIYGFSLLAFFLCRELIVTNLGFYTGKYIRWKKVLRVEEDEKQNIIIVMDYVGDEKPLLLKSELKIGKLENQEEFKQLADMYIRINS